MLKRAFSVGAGGVLLGAHAAFGDDSGWLLRESYAKDEPLLLPRDAVPSVVAQWRSQYAYRNAQVHVGITRELIEGALCHVVGEPAAEAAWNKILAKNDVIGIKCSQSGADVLGTSKGFSQALIDSLIAAGFEAGNIVVIEGVSELKTMYPMRPVALGYRTYASDFGSGTDELAAVLDQVTAIINVPFFKNHNITGFSGCLKNLSHGLVKHPARFHGGGGAPYIADIVGHPDIRSKLKLNVINGLRFVFDRGPAVYPSCVQDRGSVIVSTDPVAADAVGFSILQEIRVKNKLPEIAPSIEKVGYMSDAHRKGLGSAIAAGIRLRSETIQ